MSNNFRVGQRVVFIGPKVMDPIYGQITPDPKAIYTIRALGMTAGELHVLLEEIHNKPRRWANGFCELAMNARWFRPLVTRSTDISIFQKLLTPLPCKETA